MPARMPVLFLGHGNPMNAITKTAWARAWQKLGQRLPKPRAILMVSAHWYVPETAVTAMEQPRTIHDFGGFPQALYDVQYPASGAPWLAERMQKLELGSLALDQNWGLDHGAWSILCHLFPKADIPVVQLSINSHEPNEFHYLLGQKLRALREEGILIIGSGNIVHNLRTFAWNNPAAKPPAWAEEFERVVRHCIEQRQPEPLINYLSLTKEAKLAAPTPEHYLPLLYVLGASHNDEPLSFPIEGSEGGSLSMLSLQCGDELAEYNSNI